MKWETRLDSLDDTDRLAAALAAHVSVPMSFALCGPLGAGKTQLVRSLAMHLDIPAELVTSPTYVLVQRYRGRIALIHLDFYRLKSIGEVWDLGLDEWLEEAALTVMEWADKFPQVWPEQLLICELSITEDGCRLARFEARGEAARLWLERASSQL
jgi:tRNA threonylcarbamoyladenosine biosynthesis protein TsaE